MAAAISFSTRETRPSSELKSKKKRSYVSPDGGRSRGGGGGGKAEEMGEGGKFPTNGVIFHHAHHA